MVEYFYLVGYTSRDRLLRSILSGSVPIFYQYIRHFMPGKKSSIWIVAKKLGNRLERGIKLKPLKEDEICISTDNIVFDN